MSTPVISSRRPLADINNQQRGYAIVEGRRVPRTAGVRRPHTVKPQWEQEDSRGGSNTRFAGPVLERAPRSVASGHTLATSHCRTHSKRLGLLERIRRRTLAIVSSPGGVIISTSAIFLSITLAPVVAEEPVQLSGTAPAQIAQMK
ncbi:hypothetical protein [Corynebacterium auriscanis]|uniref:hypothetical protein n=1 Tax=Corynebacterium auriscanis TaxID=99807 RepID=UPI003CEB5050